MGSGRLILAGGPDCRHRFGRDRFGGDDAPGIAGRDRLFEGGDLRAFVLAEALRGGEFFARKFKRALVGERFALTGQGGEISGFEQQRLAIEIDVETEFLGRRRATGGNSRRPSARVGTRAAVSAS